MGWYFAAFGLFFIIIWAVRSCRRNEAAMLALAQSRPPSSVDEFVEELKRDGVPEYIGRRLFEQAAIYYCHGATPYPDDRPLEAPHWIDGDDISEICVDLWKQMGMPKSEMSKTLDANSWREIALFLERERQRVVSEAGQEA